MHAVFVIALTRNMSAYDLSVYSLLRSNGNVDTTIYNTSYEWDITRRSKVSRFMKQFGFAETHPVSELLISRNGGCASCRVR